jgi:flagellar motor switch protein FliG
MPAPIHLSRFADIVDLDDDQVRELIARVGRDDVAISLKAATEALKDKVLANVPETERLGFVEYIEQTGPMRLSEVELVQLQIVNKIKMASDDDVFV